GSFFSSVKLYQTLGCFFFYEAFVKEHIQLFIGLRSDWGRLYFYTAKVEFIILPRHKQEKLIRLL
ncbi:hypothetical protein, partial [Heyndrickxia coagulans]|uniref:hypothetical protein n=1 Tax=Heyndrickxia coagulans TaxID=1398 RepID=UPI001F1CFBFF